MISKNSKHGPKAVISGIPQWWINSHLKTNTKSTILFHNWKQKSSLPHCIIIRIHINKQTKKNSSHQIRLSTVSHFVYQNLWKALMTRILIKVWANDRIKNWTMKSWTYLGKHRKQAYVTVALTLWFCAFATASHVKKISKRHLLDPLMNSVSPLSHALVIHPWLK